MKKIIIFVVLNFLFFASVQIFGQNHALVATTWIAMGALINWLTSPIKALVLARSTKVSFGDANTWLLKEVAALASKAKITMPRLRIELSSERNAFVVGHSAQNATLYITSGLLEYLNPNQLRAVIAHELAHIKQNDVIKLTVTQGAITGLVLVASRLIAYKITGSYFFEGANLLATIFLDFILGYIGRQAVYYVSRQREYLADQNGAFIVGSNTMIDSIRFLYGDQAMIDDFIDKSKGPFLLRISTHPSCTERVRNIQKSAAPIKVAS